MTEGMRIDGTMGAFVTLASEGAESCPVSKPANAE